MGRDNALANPFSNFALCSGMRTEIKRGEAKLILENYFRNPLTRTIERANFVAVVEAEKLEKNHARHIPDPQATFGENRESRVVNFSWHMH
jgi:hypothetical protein